MIATAECMDAAIDASPDFRSSSFFLSLSSSMKEYSPLTGNVIPDENERLLKLYDSICTELRNVAERRGSELDMLRDFSNLERESLERQLIEQKETEHKLLHKLEQHKMDIANLESMQMIFLKQINDFHDIKKQPMTNLKLLDEKEAKECGVPKIKRTESEENLAITKIGEKSGLQKKDKALKVELDGLNDALSQAQIEMKRIKEKYSFLNQTIAIQMKPRPVPSFVRRKSTDTPPLWSVDREVAVMDCDWGRYTL